VVFFRLLDAFIYKYSFLVPQHVLSNLDESIYYCLLAHQKNNLIWHITEKAMILVKGRCVVKRFFNSATSLQLPARRKYM